jgi:ribonuclease HI
VDGGIGLVESCAWSLFFDDSVSSRGQGVGYIIMSPNGKSFEASARLDFEGTNNQVEYEALHCGLEHLIDMGGGGGC